MELKQIVSPASLLVALVAGAGGIAIGYWAARDPEAVRRSMRALAGGFGRAQHALAESAEHIADLWAEAREETNALIEAEKLAQASAVAVAAGSAPVAAGARPRRQRASTPAGASRRRRAATEPQA